MNKEKASEPLNNSGSNNDSSSNNSSNGNNSSTPKKSSTGFGFVVDSVLNKILRSLINKNIKSLLVNPIQKSEFETRILESHNVILKNVVFDQEKLKPKLVGLPFSLGMIKVAEIELTIPFDDLFKKSINVSISGLEVEIMPSDNNSLATTSPSNLATEKEKEALKDLSSSIYEDEDENEIEINEMHSSLSSPLLNKLELMLKKILYGINIEIDNFSLFLIENANNNNSNGSVSGNKDGFVEINIMKSKFEYILDNDSIQLSSPSIQQQAQQQQQQDNDNDKPKSFLQNIMNMFSPSKLASRGSSLTDIFSTLVQLPDLNLPKFIAQFSFQQLSVIYHKNEESLLEKQRFYLFSTKKDDTHYIRLDDNHPNQDRLNIQCEFKSSIYGNINNIQLQGLLKHLTSLFLNNQQQQQQQQQQQSSNNKLQQSLIYNEENKNILFEEFSNSYDNNLNQSYSSNSKMDLNEEIDNISNFSSDNVQKDIHIDIIVPQISYYLHLPLHDNSCKLSKPKFAIHLNGNQMRCYISRIAGFLNTDIHFESIDIDLLPNGIERNNEEENRQSGRYNCLKISGTPAIKISKRLEVLSDDEIHRLYPINSSLYTVNPFFQSHSTSYYNDEHSIEEANRLSTCNINCFLPTIDLKLKKSDYENLISSFVLSSEESTSTSIFTLFSTNANFQLLFEDMNETQDEKPIEKFTLDINRFDLFMAIGYPDEYCKPISSFTYISLDQFNSYVNYYQDSNIYNNKNSSLSLLKPELFLTNQLVELKNHQIKNQFKINTTIFEDYRDNSGVGNNYNHIKDNEDNEDYNNFMSRDDYLYTYCDSLEFQDSKTTLALGSICFVPSMKFINKFINWVTISKENNGLNNNDIEKERLQPQQKSSAKQENSIITLNNIVIHFGSHNSPRLKISSNSMVIFQLFDSGEDEVLEFHMYHTKISMRELNYKNQDYKTIGESYNSKELLFLLKMNSEKKCSKIEIIDHSYDIRITKKEYTILKSLFTRFLDRLTSLMVIKEEKVEPNPETITRIIDKIGEIHINTDYEIDEEFKITNINNNNNKSNFSNNNPLNNSNNNNPSIPAYSKENIELKEIPNHQSKIPIEFQIYIIDLVIYFHIISNDNNSSIVLEAHISELVHTTYDQSKKYDDLNNSININNSNNQQQQQQKNQNNNSNSSNSNNNSTSKSIKDYDSLLVVNISSLLIRDNVSNYYQNLLGPLSHFQMIAIDDFEIDDNEKERKKKQQQEKLSKQKETILSFIFATRKDSFNRVFHNLKLHISPLFLEFHQKSVDFLLYFFSSDELYNNFDSSSSSGHEQEIFYDEFEIYPLNFKVDYKPSSILTNHSFTKGGFVWVFQMIPLNDAYFTLPHIHIHDIGSKELSERIMSIYSPHLFGKNIFQYLGGVTPISIGIGIGKSILGLIIHPIKEAQDSENVIAGLGKGLTKGMMKITVELLTTSSKVTGFASKIFGTLNNQASHNQSIWTSQPENLTEGAKKGMSKIFGGFYNGVKGVIDPFSQSTGPINFLNNMFWAVPGLIVNPILGISDGITFFSLGLRNSLDYTRIELERKKFKPKSISSLSSNLNSNSNSNSNSILNSNFNNNHINNNHNNNSKKNNSHNNNNLKSSNIDF